MLCANNVKTYAQNLFFYPSDGNTLTGQDVILQLMDYAIQGTYTLLTPFNASTNAEIIEGSAFYAAGSLGGAVVKISSSDVIDVGSYAFCLSNIAKVELLSAKFIRHNAFDACNSLTEIYLPSCLQLFESAFANCKNLKTADFPNVTEVSKFAFRYCTALEDVDISNVEIIYTSAFDGCTKLRTCWGELAPIGAGVELNAFVVYEYAFRNCTSIEKLSCSNLQIVSNATFIGCSGIKELKLPITTQIEMEAFYGCSSLQKLSLPATEEIGMYAFAGCSGLTELALPKIKSIGYSAFSGCPNIWKVSFGKGHTEAQMITLSETIFGSSQTRATGEANASFPENLELELGENVLPKPVDNTWNGYTWKSVTVVPAETGIKKIPVANTLNVYPNPAKESATVSFELASACDVQIALSDMSGRKLTEVYKGFATAGTFTKTFNTGNLANGVYLLSILIDGNYSVKEIIVSK